VPCLQTKYACIDSGVTVPVKIVPIAYNLPENHKSLDKINNPILNNKLVFYTISEFTHRKNFSGLLRSYYASFSSSDNVVLIIKTNIPGQSAEYSEKHISNFISGIKSSLYINNDARLYPTVMVIT